MGDEFGLPKPVESPDLKVALAFPDVYEVGMSHLGFRLLHGLLCQRSDLRTERVFLPWPDLQARLQEEGIPLATLETQSPLSELDMIGLSVQYELAYPAVLKIMDLASIPRRTAERAAGGSWPLVLVGGSAALNPEPLAPFVDCFFLGEADLAIHEIVDCMVANQGAPRQQQLAALSGVEGIYVPELVQVEHEPETLGVRTSAVPPVTLPVQRRHVESLDALEAPELYLVPACNVVHDRVTIEIQRGCCQGCRFCQAGFTTRPVRQRGADQVCSAARRLLGQTGYQDLALLSLSAGDHPQLQQILAALLEEHGPQRVSVSLPSLRTESLHPAVAEHISKVRKTTFTLAPEAATDRLRRVINKQNTEQDLLRSVVTAAHAGFSRLKLYFMIGLPTETDEDVLAIAALAARVQAVARREVKKGRANISVSVSTFVPKPHTPFQWEAAPDAGDIRRKVAMLRSEMPRGVRLQWHDSGQSTVEAYLARGDRRMAEVLDRRVTGRDTGMDAWTEHFDMQQWQTALDEAHQAGQLPEPALYLGPRDPAAPLPWDHLHVGLERSYLEQEREAAQTGAVRPDCSDGTCDDCGVCPEAPLHELAQGNAERGARSAEESEFRVPSSELGDVHYHRIWFHKTGRAILLAHLEMMHIFERAARRARLPLAFSRGFHPKPRFRFSPALPLGVESRCEYMELGLTRAMAPDQLCERLAGQLPAGLDLQRCESMKRKLAGSIRGIRWELVLDSNVDEAWLQQARQRLAAGPVIVQRAKGKERDLSAVVQELELLEPRRVAVTCAFGAQGTVKPEEIMRGLLQLEPEQIQRARIVRREWRLAGEKNEDTVVPAEP